MSLTLTRRITLASALSAFASTAAFAVDTSEVWDRTDWPDTLRIGVLTGPMML